MRVLTLAAVVCASCLAVGPTIEGQGTSSAESRYLYAWAGDDDRKDSDFLAVLDITPNAERYGRVIATVPVVDRPQRYIAVAMLIPLVPAALPWVFYGAISEAVARRWMRSSRELGGD